MGLTNPFFEFLNIMIFARLELYDHSNDPEEMTHIAKQKPEVVQELLKKIKADTPVMQ